VPGDSEESSEDEDNDAEQPAWNWVRSMADADLPNALCDIFAQPLQLTDGEVGLSAEPLVGERESFENPFWVPQEEAPSPKGSREVSSASSKSSSRAGSVDSQDSREAASASSRSRSSSPDMLSQLKNDFALAQLHCEAADKGAGASQASLPVPGGSLPVPGVDFALFPAPTTAILNIKPQMDEAAFRDLTPSDLFSAGIVKTDDGSLYCGYCECAVVNLAYHLDAYYKEGQRHRNWADMCRSASNSLRTRGWSLVHHGVKIDHMMYKCAICNFEEPWYKVWECHIDTRKHMHARTYATDLGPLPMQSTEEERRNWADLWRYAEARPNMQPPPRKEIAAADAETPCAVVDKSDHVVQTTTKMMERRAAQRGRQQLRDQSPRKKRPRDKSLPSRRWKKRRGGERVRKRQQRDQSRESGRREESSLADSISELLNYGAAPAVTIEKVIEVSKVRFTHDAITGNFADGRTFADLIHQLVKGEVDPLKAPFCRLKALDINGDFFSLSNRRLHCLKKYQERVRHTVYVKLDVTKVQDSNQQRLLLFYMTSCNQSGVPPAMRHFMRSFTTRNGGEKVTVRPPIGTAAVAAARPGSASGISKPKIPWDWKQQGGVKETSRPSAGKQEQQGWQQGWQRGGVKVTSGSSTEKREQKDWQQGHNTWASSSRPYKLSGGSQSWGNRQKQPWKW